MSGDAAEVAACVWSTARHVIHLQFNISANALVIRGVQSLKCKVWCGVDCKYNQQHLSLYKTNIFSIWFSILITLPCSNDLIGNYPYTLI
jgi:hypothetical protein